MHPQHLQKLNARADVQDNHIHFVDECSSKEFYSRDYFFLRNLCRCYTKHFLIYSTLVDLVPDNYYLFRKLILIINNNNYYYFISVFLMCRGQ
jgi:hypothetical protein